MRFLIFMDSLRSDAIFGGLALLVCIAGLAIWAPRMRPSLRRTIIRAFGMTLFVVSALSNSDAMIIEPSNRLRSHVVVAVAVVFVSPGRQIGEILV